MFQNGVNKLTGFLDKKLVLEVCEVLQIFWASNILSRSHLWNLSRIQVFGLFVKPSYPLKTAHFL